MSKTTTDLDMERNVKNTIKNLFSKNGLEEEIERYTYETISKIKLNILIKPAIISFVALIISFFIDVSKVPFLGNISTEIAQYLFPSWQPTAETVTPFTFWWLPLATYVLFLVLAYLAYKKLMVEVVRTPASETIDRIMTSYTSVIDSISTALPLIGAAILLLSIRLGEEVFLGLSVPFEIKSLIILALGKLFEPILDQMGIEFQNVVNHVKDIKERYFSRLQTENTSNILSKLSESAGTGTMSSNNLSSEEIENYNAALHKTYQLSSAILKNYNSIYAVMSKIDSFDDISDEKIEKLKSLYQTISHAANSLGDEKTVTGLKYLESIVVKR